LGAPGQNNTMVEQQKLSLLHTASLTFFRSLRYDSQVLEQRTVYKGKQQGAVWLYLNNQMSKKVNKKEQYGQVLEQQTV
jgi:predicted transcriptional regulator